MKVFKIMMLFIRNEKKLKITFKTENKKVFVIGSFVIFNILLYNCAND